jgi:hypothetical protein
MNAVDNRRVGSANGVAAVDVFNARELCNSPVFIIVVRPTAIKPVLDWLQESAFKCVNYVNFKISASGNLVRCFF